MADIITTFDQVASQSVSFSGSETWVDLLAGTSESPIPSGKQIWVGFITCISPDKTITFEFRPNIPGQSTGTTGATQLRGFQAVPGGDSKDMDLYYGGNILILAPVSTTSTGVERIWMRLRSTSNSAATAELITYYTVY